MNFRTTHICIEDTLRLSPVIIFNVLIFFLLVLKNHSDLLLLILLLFHQFHKKEVQYFYFIAKNITEMDKIS